MFKYLAKTLYVLSESKLKLFILLVVFTLASILEALGIGIIGPFLEIASRPESLQTESSLGWLSDLGLKDSGKIVSFLGFIIMVIFTVKSFIFFFAKAYIFKFSYHQKGKLCVRLLNAYLSAPYTFHLDRNSAHLIENIILETEKFCVGCLIPGLDAFSNLIVIFVLFILLFKTSYFFLGMIIALLFPVILVFQFFGKNFMRWGMQGGKAQKEIVRIINHSLGDFKTTRVIGCETYFESQILQQVRILENSTTLFHASQLLPRISIEGLLVLVIVVFVSIASLQNSVGELTSTLGIFALASIRLIPSTSQFVQSLNILRNNTYALDMLYSDLIRLETLKLQSRSTSNLDECVATEQGLSFNDSIYIEQISYQYPNSPKPALIEIDLEIPKGKTIAFVGRSGSGKTTLIDVILGLLIPQHGSVYVDRKPISRDLRAWQNLVGYIPQSIFIIDDTIERNIAFGLPDDLISQDKVKYAVRAAQLEELVQHLQEGIKTQVGERGIRLSGGQRQRIGIARALYHGKEVLILDEATSALDHDTESSITEAINALSGQKTLLIVAHRLSTIEQADQIVVIENGQIAEKGDLQSLLKYDGLFAKLYSLQHKKASKVDKL